MPIALPFLENVSDEHLFQSAALVVPAWVLLVIAPRWRGTRMLASLSMTLLSIIYVFLLVQPIRRQGFVPFVEQFLTYDGVQKLFKSKNSILLSWFVKLLYLDN